MRLDKYLAESSIGRRKQVRIYVKEGKVKVNGQVVTIPATHIDENEDIIEYLDKKIEYTGRIYYMFHKPSGCITARKDDVDKTVFDYFEGIQTDGLFPVGRLDKDTEGLLFITNDGEFNHQLMYPDKHVDKTYFFWAFGSLTKETILQLENGVSIGDEEALTKPAKLEIVKAGLFEELKEEISGDKYEKVKKNREVQPVVAGYITISEGRKHQVKRMLRAVGCFVIYLKRISIGEVVLDETLKKGQYRLLTEDEIQSLINDNMKMEEIEMAGKSNCDCCSNYIYDEEEDYYECNINLDEDEYGRYLSKSFDNCPYFQLYDEYKIVRKQM